VESRGLSRPFASTYPFSLSLSLSLLPCFLLHRRPSFGQSPATVGPGDSGIPAWLYGRVGRKRAAGQKALNYIFSRALHLSDTGGAESRTCLADGRRSQRAAKNVPCFISGRRFYGPSRTVTLSHALRTQLKQPAWLLLSVIGQNGSTVDARAVDKQRDRDLDEQTSKVAILREMRDRAGGSNDPGGKWHRSLSLSVSLSL